MTTTGAAAGGVTGGVTGVTGGVTACWRVTLTVCDAVLDWLSVAVTVMLLAPLLTGIAAMVQVLSAATTALPENPFTLHVTVTGFVPPEKLPLKGITDAVVVAAGACTVRDKGAGAELGAA
jgi:hypothetical protein